MRDFQRARCLAKARTTPRTRPPDAIDKHDIITDCTACEASTLATGFLLLSFQDRSYEFHEGFREYPHKKKGIRVFSFFASLL